MLQLGPLLGKRESVQGLRGGGCGRRGLERRRGAEKKREEERRTRGAEKKRGEERERDIAHEAKWLQSERHAPRFWKTERSDGALEIE